jgi:hypothetical protein
MIGRTYNAGFRTRLTRTNLAYANEHRDWRTVAAVAQVLMRRAAKLYADHPIDPDLPQLNRYGFRLHQGRNPAGRD